jgi:tetratricopeptide (TPR) repeat protein
MPFARFCCLLMLLILPPFTVRADDPQQLLGFADALYSEGDHYRAITEYKRFLHLYPDDGGAPRALLRIAESLLAGRRWEEAERTLAEVRQRHPDTPQAERASLLLAEIPLRQGDYATAEERFRTLAQSAPQAADRRRARYRLAWALLEQGRDAAARQELAGIDEPAARELATATERLEGLPRKSPRLAGTLSALLPGAGQLYVGRPREAGLAFALNAAFLAAAWEAFDHGNEVLGGILVFFEAGWYSGNIYNAVNGAHKFNRDRREEEKADLRERFGVTLGIREGMPVAGVNLRF